MTLEEITTLFATAATTFLPFSRQPTDNDLTALRDVLYPLLLDIPFDMDGVHNLIGIIEPTASYTATWGMPFLILPRSLAYPAIADDPSTIIWARREAEHALLVHDYASYDGTEWAAAKFIHDAMDKIWYRDLCHARSFC